MKSLTIVTAIKDGGREFRETLPSVLSQSDPDFDWILVDDGSREPLAQAFPELARHPRVRIYRRSPGRGQTSGLNLAIREAAGDWIVRMDGDDLCSPDRIALLRAAIDAHPQALLVFSDYTVIDQDGRSWADVQFSSPSAAFFSYLERKNNPICHPTVAFCRLDRSGKPRQYREDLRNAQDYALWKELLAEGGPASFVHLSAPTIKYRIIRESLSGARAPEQAAELKAIREGIVAQAGEAATTLPERQKDAMQGYRILYYRFIGSAAPATLAEDMALLASTAYLPKQFFKAAAFLFLRPLRGLLLGIFFRGLYR